MSKLKLNQHFLKMFPALKVFFFLLVWNGVFHGLALSVLLYWSLTSSKVPALNRMATLNQFWMENQVLFAALASLAGSLFFKNQMVGLVQQFRSHRAMVLQTLLYQTLRGMICPLLVILCLIFSHRYEFLGFSVQLNLNFLTSYSWILRAILLLVLVASNEFLVKAVLYAAFPSDLPKTLRFFFQTVAQISIYAIWFDPSVLECVTLFLLLNIAAEFWSATAFVASFFIMTHTVFSLPFFENDFQGVFQLKAARPDSFFLEDRYLQATLFILLIAFRLIPRYSQIIQSRKENGPHESLT